MGLRVTAAGAEDTTGVAGIWPGTVAHYQKSQFASCLLQCHAVYAQDLILVEASCLICGSVMPTI